MNPDQNELTMLERLGAIGEAAHEFWNVSSPTGLSAPERKAYIDAFNALWQSIHDAEVVLKEIQ